LFKGQRGSRNAGKIPKTLEEGQKQRPRKSRMEMMFGPKKRKKKQKGKGEQKNNREICDEGGRKWVAQNVAKPQIRAAALGVARKKVGRRN